MKTLHLTLSKLPFDVMVTGEKDEEFRTQKKWIVSRLSDRLGNIKKFDQVKFTNGYGKDKPYFIAKYNGYKLNPSYECIHYSNGLIVDVYENDIRIQLGEITERGNIK